MIIDAKRGALAELIYMEQKGELNSKEEKQLDEVFELLERLEGIKIIDAPVLLNLYNLYRVQVREEDFEWVKDENLEKAQKRESPV